MSEVDRREVEKKFLKSVLDAPELSKVLDCNISANMFVDGLHSKTFSFLVDYYRDKGAFPSLGAINEHLGLDLSNIEFNFEPAYYASDIKVHYIKNEFDNHIIPSVQDTLHKKDLDNLKEVLHDYILEVEDVTNDKGIEVDLRDNVEDRFNEYIEKKELGIQAVGCPTPWPEVDEKTFGIQKGEMWVIVAKQGVGKTFASILFADRMRHEDLNGLYVTMEDPVKKVLMRWDAINAGISYGALRKGQLSEEEEDAYWLSLVDLTQESGVKIVGDGKVSTVFDLEVLIRDQEDLDYVVLDGLFMLSMTKNPRDFYLEQALAIKYLSKIALKNEIAMVVTTHFQRKGKTEDEMANSQDIARVAAWILRLIRNRDHELNDEMFCSFIKTRDGKEFHFKSNWDLDGMNLGYKYETNEKGEALNVYHERK